MNKPVIVVKLGSSTLTAGGKHISRGKLEQIAQEVIALKEQYRIVIVSSGAVATAKQFINASGWDNNVSSKQALSAIGQPRLMQLYSEVFNDYELRIAQCLMTYRDFENPISRKNTYNTLSELLTRNYIPIVNENDTTAVEELVVGDNDQLSAHVAVLLEAKLLIIASDIDGLYTKNPHLHPDAEHIREVNRLSEAEQFIQERDSELGTGGMTSKFKAVSVCLSSGCRVVLTNGSNTRFITEAIEGTGKHTSFNTRI